MEKNSPKLGPTQEDFAVAIARLILWGNSIGIKLRIKDAYRDPRLHGKWGEKKGYGAAKSVHKVSLAIDLFTCNDTDHIRLHDYWDTLGGAPRITNDMNHYSFEWEGSW